MAKLKAPCMSLGASGQLGKAIVFFPWKGLNVAREFVVPANPNTGAQQTIRGYLKDCVAAIHAAQALAALKLGPVDIAAYAAWASVVAAASTWFNQINRNWIVQKVKAKKTAIYRGGEVVSASKKLTITIYSDAIATGEITVGDFWYGTSKSALINFKDATITVLDKKATAEITFAVGGTKNFIQFRPTTHANYIGTYSGIYYGTPGV